MSTAISSGRRRGSRKIVFSAWPLTHRQHRALARFTFEIIFRRAERDDALDDNYCRGELRWLPTHSLIHLGLFEAYPKCVSSLRFFAISGLLEIAAASLGATGSRAENFSTLRRAPSLLDIRRNSAGGSLSRPTSITTTPAWRPSPSANFSIADEKSPRQFP